MDSASITFDIIDTVPVVTAAGEIDISTSPALLERFEAVPENSERAVVDLTGVTFLDSSGLGVLVACQKRLARPDATLDVVVASPHVLKLFSVTGLDSLFRIHGSREEALAAG